MNNRFKWNSDMFYALTDDGRHLPFDVLELGNSLILTLKKETFCDTKALRALPALGSAHAGDTGYWILPREISFSGDIQTFFTDRSDMTFTYSRPVMSCYGIKKEQYCCLVRIDRNYNYSFEASIKDGNYTLSVLFDFTVNDTAYDDIRIELVPLNDNADYNDMATTERSIRLSRGEIITLSDKCRQAAVEYARKYPLVRIRMGWKPSPSPVREQTPDTEPDMHIACDFARVRDIADEMKRQGVKGAELQLVGWNRSGHDGRFPQLFPADPRFGGDKGLQDTIDYVKSLGYRISTHTNTIDAYTVADSFTWDDIVVDRDGKYNQTGHYSGGLAWHVCLMKQLKNTLRDLPALAAFGENGLHFTDVISIVIPDNCHSKEHPSSTANGVLYAQKIIEYTRGLFGGFSSEGAMDFAMKDLDFALYTCFGDGFGKKNIPIADRLIPFFEVAYHGTLLYNPTSPMVNYTQKSPAERLALYMRGGRPVMYYYSKFRTGGAKNWMGESDLTCDDDEQLRLSVAAIKRAAEEYAPHADRQLVYMQGYDFLDNGLQVARYADGSRMVGNFTSEPIEYEGRTIAPLDFVVLKER